MNELLQFVVAVDWASVLIGAGTVATALGFGLGTPLIHSRQNAQRNENFT